MTFTELVFWAENYLAGFFFTYWFMKKTKMSFGSGRDDRNADAVLCVLWPFVLLYIVVILASRGINNKDNHDR